MRNPPHPLLEKMRNVQAEFDLMGNSLVGMNDGFFQVKTKLDRHGDVVKDPNVPYVSLKIIASSAWDPEKLGLPKWEHVSVSAYCHKLKQERCPTWPEMCFVKRLFWTDEESVFQIHPPKSDWINDHEFCLHMWRPLEAEIPRPPAIMVGDGSLERKRKAG